MEIHKGKWIVCNKCKKTQCFFINKNDDKYICKKCLKDIASKKAKEILNYCENYLIKDSEERINFKTSKLHKEMLKEICFFIDND